MQHVSDGTRAGPWSMVVVGFLVLALGFSMRAALGLMMPVWEQELGWSRGFVSGVMSVALVVMAILAPLAGRLVDRRGPRVTLLLGLLALTLGCLLIASTSHPWVFALGFGLVGAVGFGLIATHVVSTAIGQGFQRSIGLASGIATSGSTGGQFLIVPLIAVLLTVGSWRWAFVALGIACLLAALLVYRTIPAGVRESEEKQIDKGNLRADLGFIFRKPAFHILFWSYAICGYTTTGVIETHFLPYAAFCGFGPVPSATAYGLLSAINLGGMILAGWLADRVNRVALLGAIYLIRAATFVLLVQVGADFETLLLFSILFGLVDYSTVPVTASLVASHIGVRVMGLAFGLISAGHQLGAALGAYLGGYLFELYARYEWVWWSSLWLAVLAGLMVFLLRDRENPSFALVR